MEDRDVALEVPETELRARQVADDPDLTADLLARLSHPAHGLRLLLGCPVREVDPEDVDPRLEELTKHLRVRARRPEGGDDLGAAGVIRGLMRGRSARSDPF